ncbi:hypothetical protein [Comamonas sp. 23]|uniref:hypothetical protein n=1 Tax=Comamonas sp. 23 TaxID=3415008 RepID=UPI003C6EB0FE
MNTATLYTLAILFGLGLLICLILGRIAMRELRKNISFKFSLWSLEFDARDAPERQKQPPP